MLPEPAPELAYDFSMMSDELLEVILDAEGELSELTEEHRATLEAARLMKDLVQ